MQPRRFSKISSANYDYVLVDLSPLVPVVDTRATSGFVDSYVCVTEWGRTNVDAVKHSFKDAQNVYQNLLGFVLNKANIDRLSSYESGRRKLLSKQVLFAIRLNGIRHR